MQYENWYSLQMNRNQRQRELEHEAAQYRLWRELREQPTRPPQMQEPNRQQS